MQGIHHAGEAYRSHALLILNCTDSVVWGFCRSWMGEHNCEVWDRGYRAVALWEEAVGIHGWNWTWWSESLSSACPTSANLLGVSPGRKPIRFSLLQILSMVALSFSEVRLTMQGRRRACFKKNSSLHICPKNFWTTFLGFYPKILHFISQKFWWPCFSLRPF